MKNKPLNKAASMLGKRSAEARRKKWGKKEFVKRMREWGKLGGRPVSTAKIVPTKSKRAKPQVKPSAKSSSTRKEKTLH